MALDKKQVVNLLLADALDAFYKGVIYPHQRQYFLGNLSALRTAVFFLEDDPDGDGSAVPQIDAFTGKLISMGPAACDLGAIAKDKAAVVEYFMKWEPR